MVRLALSTSAVTQDMESSSTQCNSKKRRIQTSAEQEKAKRPKKEAEADVVLAEVIHFAALGKSAGLQQPSWCRLSHHKKHLRTRYSTRMTFASPSNNVASEIFSSEVPKVDLISAPKPNDKLKKALKNHPVITKFGMERKGQTAYVLTQEERIKNTFLSKGLQVLRTFCAQMQSTVSQTAVLYMDSTVKCV
ncbi:hypothetical protein OJAV_G00003680 [Oryzias javanicus]|uniref:Uncharacterized protein n=1 Tax=Oryzias javanicus TaxID=123683 RepID=A0A437DLS1_ORYJA|nr:hypothetical protein OJAV_G00003680 [Oryzias javanicus]